MKWNWKNVSLELRLFWHFYAVALLMVILLGVAGGIWASRTARENSLFAYQSELSNCGVRISNHIDGLSDSVNLLKNNRTVQKITYMQGSTVDYSRVTPMEFSDCQTELLLYCATSPLIDNIILCFPQKDCVITTNGSWKLSWLFDDEFVPLNQDVEQLRNTIGKSTHVPNMSISSFGHEREGIAFFRPGISSTKGEALMAVIFWMDTATIRSQLTSLLVYDGTVVSFYDSEDRLLCSAGSQASAENGEVSDIYVSWTSSDGAWQICAQIPEESLFRSERELLGFLLIVLLLLAFLGAIASWRASKASYYPFKHLFSTMHDYIETEAVPSKSGVTRIEERLAQIIKSYHQITQDLSENRELAQYATLHHLLKGDSFLPKESQQVAAMMLSTVGLTMPYHWFRVLSVTGCPDMEALCGTLCAEVMGHSVKIASLLIDKLSVLIINYQHENTFQNLMMQAAANCDFVCVSSASEELHSLSRLYRQMNETFNRRPLFSEEKIYYYDELRQPELLRYTPADEKKLMEYLLNGDEVKLQEHLNILFRLNDSLEALQKLCAALETTIMKTEDGTVGLGNSIQSINKPDMNDPGDMIHYLQSIFSAGTTYHRQTADNAHYALAEKLKQYINEHICSEQLSLTNTAAEFSMSTSYLSRYFKEQFGIGYLDYVNRKRVAIAKELLQQEGMTVKEAAQLSGFGNDVTLRRVFKKYEGVAPTKILTS